MKAIWLAALIAIVILAVFLIPRCSAHQPTTRAPLSETFTPDAAAAIASNSRIAIRRVFADFARQRPTTYSSLQTLSEADARIVRSLFSTHFSRNDPNAKQVKACGYHPDMQFYLYDPLGQLVARIELCLGCGDWIMIGVTGGGYWGMEEFKRIMVETCPPPFLQTFTE